MSKKSRKRNKKILGALGALGLGLALANRGKGTEMSNISVDSGRGSGLRPTVDDNKVATDVPKKVYEDAIMRGGKGVKQGFKSTSANVQSGKAAPPGFLGFSFDSPKISMKTPDLKFGQVITKEGKKKTIKPFESAGLSFGPTSSGTSRTQKAVNKANREMAAGRLPPQLRAPGRTDITTRAAKNRQFFKDIGNFIFPKANFKSGGRVKKTKVTGIAKRGFGKALKGGKK